MTIETLTEATAAILLGCEELAGREAGEQLCALVRQIQREQGFRPWGQMEAEVFICGQQALLLARPIEIECFRFADFETLLAAVQRCSPETDAALTYLDGDWILKTRCPAGHTPLILWEYGSHLEGGAALAIHLQEQGQPLLTRQAVARLQQVFSSR